MKLGNVIRKYRLMMEWDLRRLAHEIGIAPSTLMRIEMGFACDSATLAKILNWLMRPEERKRPDATAGSAEENMAKEGE